MNGKAKQILLQKLLITLLLVPLTIMGAATFSHSAIADQPLFLSQSAPPLNLLVMGRDHKLYYEAYNDASDLDGNGTLDVGYKPDDIDYYGYFNSYSCYENLTRNLFEPSSSTTDKTCSGSAEWSGDFLNYLTTSRIDALRKVLYGGTRSTDDATTTILERTYIPQDAHSWGKEYTSVADDGYDIADYTPLALPLPGTRHLFANTTLLNTTAPLLRVLNDSNFRVWEWLSIEQEVAGDDCDNGSRQSCTTGADTVWQIVPATAFTDLTQTVYSLPGGQGHPANHTEYETFVTTYATAANLDGSQAATVIDGSGNPFVVDQENYMTIFTGKITIPADGNYDFAVNGDDAVEVIIAGDTSDELIVGYYDDHAADGGTSYNDTGYFVAGTYSVEYRHEEAFVSDSWQLYWGKSIPASAMTDYEVRVEVCNSGLTETNCKLYPNGDYKPTGLLHEYGEDGRMKFGLLTGSYENNTQGGVLRKAVSAFTDEVDSATGQYTGTVGIVKTIDRLKIANFGGDGDYDYDGSRLDTQPLSNGQFSDWGNPLAEMMYEGVRYFSGKAAASTEFDISSSGNDDADLGLPLATWDDPYSSNPTCAEPFELVISDINPSYDSDSLPGIDGDFGSGISSDLVDTGASDWSDINVKLLGDSIWDHEFGSTTTKSVFIGQVDGTYDGSPSPKTVSSFGNIRGLAPEEPTKQGSYYAAAVAYYAKITDLNTAADDQKMNTFSVALASPLPQIDIPVNGQTITLVPFAKSVGGNFISASSGSFQATNTIVDFYIDTLTPTSGLFRINFEDVEQGADHDMDAIVEYSYLVKDDNTVDITLTSTYADGSIVQHMGYVISGTTKDGTYLEIRDCDTANLPGSGTCSGNNPATDPDYFLDTPDPDVFHPDVDSTVWDDDDPLPLTRTRNFTPDSSGAAATFLKDPLWYAAKYGFFDETVDGAIENDLPDTDEYGVDADGNPDNYFLVTNALTLSQKLNTAFQDIVGVTTSAAAVATNSTRLDTNTMIYQASFDTEFWAGQLTAYPLLTIGGIGSPEWAAGDLLDAVVDPEINRDIFTFKPTSGAGVTFEWANLDTAQKDALKDPVEADYTNALLRLVYLRGEQCNEEQNELASPSATCGLGIFRDRTSILGDIVNSDPWFVGNQNYGYTALPSPEGTSYYTYRSSTAYVERTDVLYVGANDGMLHAFDAGPRDTTASPQLLGGKELFTYVPNLVFDKLSAMTAPSYSHQYSVDGPVRATDAYLDLDGDAVYEWETILVGGLGAGGKGIYALRVTDPDNFSASDVLWEITPATTGYAEIGQVFDQPFIVRMANGDWAAVFGNGYNSASGTAVLYITDLHDGSLIKAIDVGGTLSGMSGVAPVDFDGGVSDSIVDAIYAGDLLGNLWKFDVSDVSASKWVSAHAVTSTKAPLPMFTAVGGAGNAQPITVRPEVGAATATVAIDDVMIYFGTGQYFETGDNIVVASPAVETFYGILDDGTRITTTDRSDLTEQTISVEAATLGFEVRALSSNLVDYTTEFGWYLDLESPTDGAQGERVVERAQLIPGKLVFVTLIPNIDACEFGGDSWLMLIDPETGGRLNGSIFDLNNDNVYDSDDEVTDPDTSTGVAVSGKKSTTGIISAPAVISGGDVTHLITSGTDTSGGGGGGGGLEDEEVDSGGITTGRGSWRQIR